MTRLLSLAHMTVIDADPITLIDAAVAGGFDAIGLRIVPPVGSDPIIPVVGDAVLQRRIKSRLRETGLALLDIEAIWLTPETDIEALLSALDVGAALGARYVLACGHDPDRGRMTANLSLLCQAASERGMRVMLEFIPYTHIRNLAEAAALLADVAPSDAGLLVDALHLSRSGGGPADLGLYDPTLFSYMHLCDAPRTLPLPDAIRAEARGGRSYPGEGELWLNEFLAAFPPATPAAVEAPCDARRALTPAERSRLSGAAARTLMAHDETRLIPSSTDKEPS